MRPKPMNRSECFEYLGVRSNSTSVHNGKESDWMYVRTNQGEIGWVFSRYVEKISGYSGSGIGFDDFFDKIKRGLQVFFHWMRDLIS